MRDLDSKIRALQQLELDSPGFNQSTKTLESIKATRSAMSIGDYSTPLHGLRAILIGSVYGIDFSLGIVSLIRGFTAIAARFGSGDFSVRIDPRRKNEFGVMAGHFNSVAAALGVLIGQLLYPSGNLSESTSKLTAAAEISNRSAAAGEIAASVNRLRSSARRSKKEAKGK